VPTMAADAQPSGTIARGAYDTMKAELIAGIEAVMPVDGVALCADVRCHRWIYIIVPSVRVVA